MGFLNEGSSGEGGRSQAFYFAEPLAIFPKLCWRWGGGTRGDGRRKETSSSIMPLEYPVTKEGAGVGQGRNT